MSELAPNSGTPKTQSQAGQQPAQKKSTITGYEVENLWISPDRQRVFNSGAFLRLIGACLLPCTGVDSNFHLYGQDFEGRLQKLCADIYLNHCSNPDRLFPNVETPTQDGRELAPAHLEMIFQELGRQQRECFSSATIGVEKPAEAIQLASCDLILAELVKYCGSGAPSGHLPERKRMSCAWICATASAIGLHAMQPSENEPDRLRVLVGQFRDKVDSEARYGDTDSANLLTSAAVQALKKCDTTIERTSISGIDKQDLIKFRLAILETYLTPNMSDSNPLSYTQQVDITKLLITVLSGADLGREIFETHMEFILSQVKLFEDEMSKNKDRLHEYENLLTKLCPLLKRAFSTSRISEPTPRGKSTTLTLEERFASHLLRVAKSELCAQTYGPLADVILALLSDDNQRVPKVAAKEILDLKTSANNTDHHLWRAISKLSQDGSGEYYIDPKASYRLSK